MTYPNPELKDIGRFIHARRIVSNASDNKDLPRRRRHVPYITQEELADLVDVSPVVISQIEQGRYPNLSGSILGRIARALSFSQQQKMFAFGLLSPVRPKQETHDIAPKWMLDSIADTQHPTVVMTGAYDLLGWNKKTEAMFGNHAAEFFSHGNAMTPIFEMPEMKAFFVDWAEYATSMVSGLRMTYAVHSYLREYVRSLADTLCERDELFRTQWMKDDPLVIPTIEKELEHPSLGRLRMIQVITIVVEAPNLTMVEFLPADDETRAKLATVLD